MQPDAVAYTGPANTLTTKDTVEFKRVMPKPTSTFKGVARPTFKQVKTVEINATTGETADAIVQLTASLPVGMTDAAIDAFLADLAAFAASTPAADLFKKLDINS
jgi:hypothetical protein